MASSVTNRTECIYIYTYVGVNGNIADVHFDLRVKKSDFMGTKLVPQTSISIKCQENIIN